MFCCKKIKSREINNKNDEPIDFIWITYIGMNKLGFTYRQVGHLYIGLLLDLFEAYKKQYNFETRRTLYDIQQDEVISSLSVL